MKLLSLLILLVSFTANAADGEQYFGDWKVGSWKTEGGVVAYANTTNESQSTLGMLCLSSVGECFPYIVNGLTCQTDGVYPALVSIDDGLTAVDMECVHIEDRHLFALPETHLEYMVASNSYGVAFGTSGGKFKAAYFSLSGSAKAIIAANQIMEAAQSKSKNNTPSNSKFQDTYL